MSDPAFFSEITTYELAEFMYLVRDAAATDLTTFMTALFAFLVTAYFAGGKLSRFQFVVVLFTYSLFSLATIQSLYVQLSLVESVAEKLKLNDSQQFTYTIEMFVALIFVVWLLSIGFLVEVRLKSDR